MHITQKIWTALKWTKYPKKISKNNPARNASDDFEEMQAEDIDFSVTMLGCSSMKTT
jgi:hypothetical protein